MANISELAKAVRAAMRKEKWVKVRFTIAHDNSSVKATNNNFWPLGVELPPMSDDEVRELSRAVYELAGSRVSTRIVKQLPPAKAEAIINRRQENWLARNGF